MQSLIIENIEVLYSEYKMKENSKLESFLSSKELKNFLKRLEKEALVVVGGDGSMLEAIGENYQRKIPFLGINFGNKGFLLNDIDILNTNTSFETRKYPLLECSLEGKKKIALNEFDIKAGEGKMLDLNIAVRGGHSIDLIGDGLIISTPTGSTGYNSSLGGPILPYGLNTYVITPKAPWKPRLLPPIILKDNSKITITTKGRISPVEIYSDGKAFSKITKKDVKITVKKSNYHVTLLISKEHLSYWDNKVLEEQGFTLTKSK